MVPRVFSRLQPRKSGVRSDAAAFLLTGAARRRTGYPLPGGHMQSSDTDGSVRSWEFCRQSGGTARCAVVGLPRDQIGRWFSVLHIAEGYFGPPDSALSGEGRCPSFRFMQQSRLFDKMILRLPPVQKGKAVPRKNNILFEGETEINPIPFRYGHGHA